MCPSVPVGHAALASSNGEGQGCIDHWGTLHVVHNWKDLFPGHQQLYKGRGYESHYGSSHNDTHTRCTYVHEPCHLCVCHVNHHVSDMLEVDVEQLSLEVQHKQGENIAISQQCHLLLHVMARQHTKAKQLIQVINQDD